MEFEAFDEAGLSRLEEELYRWVVCEGHFELEPKNADLLRDAGYEL